MFFLTWRFGADQLGGEADEEASEGGLAAVAAAAVAVFVEETSTFSTALPPLPFFLKSATSAGMPSLFENIAPADLEMTAAPAAAQAIMPRTSFFFFL